MHGVITTFNFKPGDKVDVPSIGLTDAVVETCGFEAGGIRKYYVLWMGNGTVSGHWFGEDLVTTSKGPT